MRLLSICALACCGALWSAAEAGAAPADLDRSFGNDGIVEVRGPGGGLLPSEAGARMAIGPRDEIFVLYSNYPPCEPPFDCTVELSVARYEPDGELDPSFGAGAAPQLVVQQNAFSHDFGIAIGRDGKAVITANGYLVRLGLDGHPDPTFGVAGKTQPSGSHRIESARGGPAIAVQPDGEVVVAGEGVREEAGSELIIARYLPNGEFDPGFGSAGEVAVDLSTQGKPLKALVAPAGGVYAPGPQCCIGGTPLFGEGFSVVRVLPDGQPDPGWAGSGRLFFPTPGAQGAVEAAALAPDGGLYVSFEEEGSSVSRVGNLVRLRPDGSLDPSFGRQGRIQIYSRVGLVSPSDLGVDRRRRIVGVGWSGRISVFRLRPDGTTDRTFNGGRRLVLRYGGDHSASAPYLVGLQAGGRIIVLGESGCCHPKAFGLIGLRGGTDHSRCLGKRATIVGTRGRDELTGTRHRDVIAALGGSDEVRALAGNDLICGGRGKDELFGGPGRDQVRQDPLRRRSKRATRRTR